ncbi:HNH endonuclease [Burkholderia oklahomensis]|uniref:HNH endonuclease n=1 Tax=Burkholderia oklahomensis TaxID=342113 RepID=UPI00016A8A46|nr:HNH endonuclease [Burkholderia oklahomensis]MBI0362036.1 HNH endonuclease [Burkholderia oklahomensis]
MPQVRARRTLFHLIKYARQFYPSERGDLAIQKNTKYSRLRGEEGVKQRQRIRIRDKHICQRCGIAVRTGEVDHIIPLEQGGTNEDENLHLLCIDCHKKKTATDRGYTLKSGSSVDGLPTDSSHHWNS